VLLSKVRIFSRAVPGRQKLADANPSSRPKTRAARAGRAEARPQQPAPATRSEVAYRGAASAQLSWCNPQDGPLGELVAGVAHEITIRSPSCSAPRNDAQELDQFRLDVPLKCRREPKSSGTRSLATTRRARLGRIATLVLKLRTFSRLDEGERKRVSLS